METRRRKPAAAVTAMADRRVVATAALLGAATVLVKLVALTKDWLVARNLGAGDDLDAYLVAFLLPSYGVAVLGHSFAPAFLPSYVRVGHEQGPRAARHLAGAALAVGTVGLLLVAALLALSAPAVLPLVGSGFDAEKLALATRLFDQMVIVLVASGTSSIVGAVLNAHERFRATALAPLAVPAGTLVVFAAGQERYGVEALAWGTSAGFVVESLMLIAITFKQGWISWPRGSLTAANLRGVAHQYWPMAASSLLMSGSLVVDQSMAASLGSGNVSVLSYAGKIVALVLGVVAASLSTVLFPQFSRLIVAGEWSQLQGILARFTRRILLGSLPLVAALIALSEPMIRLLFERGAFTAETTAAVSQVQQCLFPQIPFYVLAMLGSRMLSALHANRLVLAIAALNLALNVGGNYVLMHHYGVRGIAMSTSLVYLVAACATLAAIRWKLRAVLGDQAR